MNYERLTSEWDKDIPYLLSIYRLPEISRYIHIDEVNYWHYVASNENVFYYKVYDGDRLVAAIHCELSDKTLFMDIVVLPEYQRRGIATGILWDIQNGHLPLAFERIEVAIEEGNIASIKLFEKMNFVFLAKDGELINYVYQKLPQHERSYDEL